MTKMYQKFYASSYLALWTAIALRKQLASVAENADRCISLRNWTFVTYLPLGSVCLDHLGVHRMTVDAHEGGKCSSNMVRYQYLHTESLG